MFLLRGFVFLSVVVLVGCQPMVSDTRSVNKDFKVDVIYGEDNRLDFYEVKDENWVEIAQSTAALFDKDDLQLQDGIYQVQSTPFGQSFHLCEDEPFYEQPSSAFCSGFLIGPKLMITAGHCLRNDFNCENVRFAFGYHYTDAINDPTKIPKKNVYKCNSLIHSQANGITGSDFAIIELNKEVKGFAPLLVRTEGSMSTDTELTVIGYPSGLPGKMAFEGLLRSNSPEAFFVSTLDTYGGNSGSAVFNSETRLVEGILVRGDTDFAYDQESQCRRSNLCKETECRGEDVTRISEIFNYISPNDLQ